MERVFEKKDAICIISGDKHEEADLAEGRERVPGTACQHLNLHEERGEGSPRPGPEGRGVSRTRKSSAEDTLSLRCGYIHAEMHSFVQRVFLEHVLGTTLCSEPWDTAANQPPQYL